MSDSMSDDGLCSGRSGDPDLVLPPGVHGLESLAHEAVRRGWGSTRLATRLIALADVVVCNFHHLLDPKLSQLLFPSLRNPPPDRCVGNVDTSPASILLFDEAHNLDAFSIEALSLHLTLQTVSKCADLLKRLAEEVRKIAADPEDDRLERERDLLVTTPVSQLVYDDKDDSTSRGLWAWNISEVFGAPPCLVHAPPGLLHGVSSSVSPSHGVLGTDETEEPAKPLQQLMPGSVRKAAAFVGCAHVARPLLRTRTHA